MSEWHDYNEDNISSCQECNDLHDKYKYQEGQVEDYHEKVPIGEETLSQKYNIPENNENNENKTKKTKRAYDASISNLVRGDNVRFKKGNFGNSQLDNLEVYDDDDNNNEIKDSSYGGKRRRTHRKKTHYKKKTYKRKTNRRKKHYKKKV